MADVWETQWPTLGVTMADLGVVMANDWLWPDWGNNTRAATVGLGSIGLKGNSSQKIQILCETKMSL